ncbi:MAG: hypothetical protein ACFFDW_15730 [Candidatus Thorarchaeota archaeon]
MKLFRSKPSKKDKTLWTEYPDYSSIYNVEEKPLYDETKVNDEHRVLGQIIRENWELVHPLAQDYILSSAHEWRKLLNQLHGLQETESHDILQTMKEEFEQKIEMITFEKEAEIEKVKMEVVENYREIIEQKNKEIEHYKILADSVKTTFDEKKISNTNLETELSSKDKRIMVLEKLVNDLRNQNKSQEVEAMNVQTGISKNFQQQISEMTAELYNRQDQIDKLRAILSKAKDQLIELKDKNGELVLRNKQNETKISSLEIALEERDKKLKQVIKTIENLEQ